MAKKRGGRKRDNYYRGQYTRPAPGPPTPVGRPQDWADVTPAETRPISMGPNNDQTFPEIPPPLATDYGVGGNYGLPGMDGGGLAPAVPDPTGPGADIGFQGQFLTPEQAAALSGGMGGGLGGPTEPMAPTAMGGHRVMSPGGLHPIHLNMLANLARARAAAMTSGVGSEWGPVHAPGVGHARDWSLASPQADPWTMLAQAARRRLAQHAAGAI